MRVVSIGDLVTDYYYKDGKLIGANGGMTSHNIIANLAKMGIKTSTFACCGNDIQGKIAINSLEKINVDVENIKIIENVRTRCFHVSYYTDNGKLSFTSKKRCPFCNNKKWYDESLLDTDFILSNIKEDDIIISHMFPFYKSFPKYAESWIVNLTDKVIGTNEFMHKFNFKMSYATNLALLFIINHIK